jgi:hypothetical protein
VQREPGTPLVRCRRLPCAHSADHLFTAPLVSAQVEIRDLPKRLDSLLSAVRPFLRPRMPEATSDSFYQLCMAASAEGTEWTRSGRQRVARWPAPIPSDDCRTLRSAPRPRAGDRYCLITFAVSHEAAWQLSQQLLAESSPLNAHLVAGRLQVRPICLRRSR